jgi:hypothetical protein
MICNPCVQQLKTSYIFLNRCRQTLLAAQVVVKQEPGLNFVDMMPAAIHKPFLFKEELSGSPSEDDESLLVPGTAPNFGRTAKKARMAVDPDCEFVDFPSNIQRH